MNGDDNDITTTTGELWMSDPRAMTVVGPYGLYGRLLCRAAVILSPYGSLRLNTVVTHKHGRWHQQCFGICVAVNEQILHLVTTLCVQVNYSNKVTTP